MRPYEVSVLASDSLMHSVYWRGAHERASEQAVPRPHLSNVGVLLALAQQLGTAQKVPAKAEEA